MVWRAHITLWGRGGRPRMRYMSSHDRSRKKPSHRKRGKGAGEARVLPLPLLVVIAALGLGLMIASFVLSREGAGRWGGLFPLPYVGAAVIAGGGLCLLLTLCFLKRRLTKHIYPFVGFGCVIAVIGLMISLLYVGFGWEMVPAGARSVDLSGRGLRDVTAIRRLTRLESAVLSNNEIEDASPLSGLKSLHFADLTGNPIPDDNGRAVREALPECVILAAAPDSTTSRISLYRRPLPGFGALREALSAYSALKTVDTRGSMLACEQINRLRGLFPAVTFLTVTAPDGSDMPDGAGEALLQVTSEEDACEALDRFPALEKVTLTGALFSPEEYSALTGRYPNVDIACQIKVYGRSWPTDAAYIDMSQCAIDGRLLEYLALFGHMTQLNLPELTPDEALSIMAAEPGIDVSYLIGGATVSKDTTELSLRGRGVPEPDYVLTLVKTAPSLQRLLIDDPDEPQRAALKAADTGLELVYNIPLLDCVFSTDTDTMDFGERIVTDAETAQIEAVLPYMTRLENVNMFESKLSQETMDHLFDTYPDLFFGWTFSICNGGWTLRSDVTAFSTLKTVHSKRYGTEHFRNLRYCKRLMALDLGHNEIDDISWLSNYPHMRILILADNLITDFSVISELKELEYAEFFINEMESLDCLADHDRLIDLNICFDLAKGQTSRDDVSPLLTLTSLERLWISHNGLNADQINQLVAGLPNTKIEWHGESTGNGWREHWRFPIMISIFKTRVYREWKE